MTIQSLHGMRWVNITCSATEHIIPVQKFLFDKYVGIEPEYINLNQMPVKTWCLNVLEKIKDIEGEFIIFGLDDYLPIDKINTSRLEQAYNFMKSNPSYDRFELGWGASKKKGMICIGDTCVYGDNTPYTVSCQFSIWRTKSLRNVLSRIKGSPWEFEIKGRAKAVCFDSDKCALRWIEESALSARQLGKVNILGVKPSDVNELVDLNLLDRDKLIYGWKGATKFSPDLAGKKYMFNYE